MEIEIYDSPLVASYYEESENMEIVLCNKDSDLHLVCFSDNGLFYPWTEKMFQKNVIEKDKYQWKNLTKHKKIRKKYKSVVFLRDIYQSWYINGISEHCDTPYKVEAAIKEKTGGGRYVTVGSSAGGYYSVLIGALLNAEYIVSFLGQFFIGNKYETNPLIQVATREQRRFFDLKPYVDSYKGKIFYFCPYNCERDREQWEKIKFSNNVYSFLCRSELHGFTIIPQSMQWTLYTDEKRLEKNFNKEFGKVINEREFLIKTNGFFSAAEILLRRWYNHKILHKY